MGFWDFNRTKGYRNLMAKVYGLGASVVLIGALFKINHYPGADTMLIIGLSTEALIFFLSAFEVPHVDPDWSLVYPQLGENQLKGGKNSNVQQSPINQLDDMLEKANIDQEVIDRLGSGIEQLSENAVKIADVSHAAVASNEFAENISNAGQSAQHLSQIMDEDVKASGNYAENMQVVNDNANILSNAYVQAADILKGNMDSTEEFVGTVKQASVSARSLAENYEKSASALAQSVEALAVTTENGDEYNLQVQKVAENLASLNVTYEAQLRDSQKTADTSDKLQNTFGELLESLDKSASQTGVFVEQMQLLTKRMESLNKVYGNMLTAMNIQS